MDQTAQGLPPEAALLQMLTGRWVSQAISAAAELGVADALAGGPRTAEQLAPVLSAHASTLRRLLRALASVGVFGEDAQGRFHQTPVSHLLRAGVAGSLRGMACYVGSDAATRAWGELVHSVRSGDPAFRRVHGRSFFEHLRDAPAEAAAFDAGMHGVSMTEIPALLDAYDFGELDRIVDVGGGDGTLLTAILERHARPRGVLYDLAHVVARARARLAGGPHAARLEFAEGSFFEAVPAGGSAYLLKHIVHDWSDELSVRILHCCRRSIPADGRLLLVEAVLESGSAQPFGQLLDLEMLVMTEGGRERTESEFADLLSAAGFALERVVGTRAPTSLVEARPR
jgi:hypothetical protein